MELQFSHLSECFKKFQTFYKNEVETLHRYEKFERLELELKPLSKLIMEEMKILLTVRFDDSAATVQQAFSTFCHYFLTNPSFTLVNEKSTLLIEFALASFTLSIRANPNIKESTELIKKIITSKWIEIKGFQEIRSYLNKIAVYLDRNNKIEEIECEQERVDSLTLYSLLLPVGLPRSKLAVILEQALIAYEKVWPKYPEFSHKMQMKITDILLQDIYISPDCCFQKAQVLVKKASALRIYGPDGLGHCIQCFNEAITIMENSGETGIDKHANVHHDQLAVAYCLRAVFTQEAEPSSNNIFEDIKAALDLWLKISHAECSVDKLSLLPDNIMILMYNMIDLLHLKGFLGLCNDAYRLIMKIFELKKFSIKEWLTLLWGSRRLSHALCASPVCEEFILNSSTQCCEVTDVEFWKRSLQENQSMAIGFQQNFSFLFASSNTKPDVIEVEKAAKELISEVSDPSHSTFFAANILYDLCPNLIANGQLKKALFIAKEALTLHKKLFLTYLTEDDGHNGLETRVRESVARAIIQFDSRKLEYFYLSPWKIMQCYLQSILQVGIILENIGDGDSAQEYLQLGKYMSCKFDLPLFTAIFSTILGKIYIEKKQWKKAKEELESAKKFLKDSGTTLCCSKCKLIFEVTHHQYYGDFYLNNSDIDKGIRAYMSALDILYISEWKNSISCPDEDDNDNSATYSTAEAKVLGSGLLNNFINFKWEFLRRQLSLKLLIRLVKCFADLGQDDKTCHFLGQSISVLASRNPFHLSFSPFALDLFQHVVPKEIPRDIFATERAEIVYETCWWLLKSNHSNATRNIFCDKSSILFQVLPWLNVAFVLSREVSLTFQKVSKLLAVMYLYASCEQASLSSFSKPLGENSWASYFHQASIGRCTDSDTCKPFIREGTSNLLRLVPDTAEDLAKYVQKFLDGLPSTAIICISLLGLDYANLLQKLFHHPTSVKAWMLVSRLSIWSEPVVILLPLDSILRDSDDDSGIPPPLAKPSTPWRCPWSFTVVDDVAPSFKTIMEEHHCWQEDVKQESLFWKRKENADYRLKQLLRNLEDLWLGSWKCLFLGEWLNHKNFDRVFKNLVNDLKSKCKSDVNEGLLKVILLGGSKFVCKGTARVSLLCSKKDCYMAKVGCRKDARSAILLNNAANEFEESPEDLFKLLNDALHVLIVDEPANREPLILLLDHEVQMLPWENLPILRKQEVYRMPSLGSILAVLDQDPFPSIDPEDAFYLLNPDGDVTLTRLKKWYEKRKPKGKMDCKPTPEEFGSALTSHDLFIYVGHGSGKTSLNI